jgi:hypothetical protein
MGKAVIFYDGQHRIRRATPMTQDDFRNDDRDEFSVCQFFPDGSSEYVRRFVSAREAVEAAKHCTETVGGRIGIVTRIIITDGGDCTCFEWKYGSGITYPKRSSQ